MASVRLSRIAFVAISKSAGPIWSRGANIQTREYVRPTLHIAFRAVADKLHVPDVDTPARIVLLHPDLLPRNIFIDESTGALTGVIDWDRAESAPVEAAWQVSAWLWDDHAGGTNQLEWVNPGDVPEGEEVKLLREYFLIEVEKALPGFIDTVRRNEPLYQLLRFARFGLCSYGGLRMVEVFGEAIDFIGRMGVEREPIARDDLEAALASFSFHD